MVKSIYAGDDEELEFTVYKEDGSTQDLTGMTINWGLGGGPNTSAVLTKSTANTGEITIVGPAADGRFDVILVPTDTAELAGDIYYHEVELTDSNGKTFTVFDGHLRIKPAMI